MATVPTALIGIYFTESGSGGVVLFVPGWYSSKVAWRPVGVASC
ncbi:hypothetical protein [Rhodoferax sp. PAMC 29310]|jgi:hypothetical protein|nr:hypothetical protein [Rhodoferax sp. PAMC 29310]